MRQNRVNENVSNNFVLFLELINTVEEVSHTEAASHHLRVDIPPSVSVTSADPIRTAIRFSISAYQCCALPVMGQ